jgi:predicted nucleotidyltransferase
MPKGSSSSVRVYYPKFDRQQLIQKLKEDLEALKEKLPLLLVILFGSYAKGNYTVASDVDLLVVYKGRERKDAFATVKKTIPIPRLEPHVYSESEYEAVKETISNMTKDGVVLFDCDGRV